MTLVVKTGGRPMSLARNLEKRIQNVDPEQLVAVGTLQEIVKESVFPVQIVMNLPERFRRSGVIDRFNRPVRRHCLFGQSANPRDRRPHGPSAQIEGV